MTAKNFLLFITFSATSFLFCKKDVHPNQIQLSFISTPTKKITDSESKETFDYCIEIIKSCAILQEQRQLTLEEITYAMQAIMFLYLAQTDDFNKKIEVLISGKKLTLPYSEELIARLLGKNDTNQPSNE